MTTPVLGSTESRNPATTELDTLSTIELVRVMNSEDRRVADAVAQALPAIGAAVDLIVDSFERGGRLIYAGAGTSGRLGVLDASECPPTFGAPPTQVVGLIAGGRGAMFQAVEGAEDDDALGRRDLDEIGLTDADTVVGIAASGGTPYVQGALRYAASIGAHTVSIACNRGAAISALASVAIEVDNGPEVLTGSTRLKAGTSQKMILNMLSTASMVKIGKVYGNLMVDVSPTNAKLNARAVRIVCAATDCSPDEASAALAASGQHAKTAIVMVLCGLDADAARSQLAAARGFIRAALDPSTTRQGSNDEAGGHLA